MFNINKLLRILSEELILNKISILIFQNRNINHLYEKTIKYLLLLLVYFKISIQEFPYDNIIKPYLKKIIEGLTVSFLIIYENYILNPQISKFLFKSSDIHDNKFLRVSKLHNVSKGIKYQDVMVIVLKNIEMISQQIKIFSK